MTDPMSPTSVAFPHKSESSSSAFVPPSASSAQVRPANVRSNVRPTNGAAAAVPPHYVNAQASDDDKVDLAEALQNAPPWLISLVVHMSALILLGLTYAATKVAENNVEVQAVYGEQIGDQLLDNSLGLTTDTPDPTVDKAVFSPSDLPPVADPLAAPPLVSDFSPLGTFGGSNQAIDAPIGLALSGREKGMKKALLGRYGGNKLTEDSVHLCSSGSNAISVLTACGVCRVPTPMAPWKKIRLRRPRWLCWPFKGLATRLQLTATRNTITGR